MTDEAYPLNARELSFIRETARSVVAEVLQEHRRSCPIDSTARKVDDAIVRVTAVESRLSLFIGLMVGSGSLGGVAGAVLTKLLG